MAGPVKPANVRLPSFGHRKDVLLIRAYIIMISIIIHIYIDIYIYIYDLIATLYIIWNYVLYICMMGGMNIHEPSYGSFGDGRNMSHLKKGPG